MSGFNDHIEIYYNRKEIVSKYFRENKVTGYTTSIKLKKKSFKKPNELVVLLKKNRQKLVVNLNNNYNFLRIFYSNKKWTLHYDNEDVVLEQ
ncbi:MAG: hypothetical protein CFE24_06845 [Flavobacterium sp. BFFFF2]|nr:MAG: hypothetical protein CFE24_06845 [Flavobacterium sp. BFFFF2]